MARIEFEQQVKGYGLTTANILYRLPDHPAILQEFLWQHYDLAPDFPELLRFLEFWDRKIEGPVHSVRVAHKKLVGSTAWRSAGALYRLH